MGYIPLEGGDIVPEFLPSRAEESHVPLREHIEALIVALRQETASSFASVRREFDATDRTAKEATDKANSAMDKRLDHMNEFRDQLRDQAAKFVTRDLVDERIVALEKLLNGKTDSNGERIGRLETKGSNLDGRFWAIGAVVIVVNLLIAVAGLLLRFPLVNR